jgi:hypothetical protein
LYQQGVASVCRLESAHPRLLKESFVQPIHGRVASQASIFTIPNDRQMHTGVGRLALKTAQRIASAPSPAEGTK